MLRVPDRSLHYFRDRWILCTSETSHDGLVGSSEVWFVLQCYVMILHAYFLLCFLHKNTWFINKARKKMAPLIKGESCPVFGLEGFWGQPQGPNFPFPCATKLASRVDCSTAALTTPQKVLSICKLVELKMLDFSYRTKTGISILTSAADWSCPLWSK